ncbi:MAG: hypothetical protein SOU82_02710 [Alloprevotella sp.]|nr:hypothetical protein [Alloprevotella sp.]
MRKFYLFFALLIGISGAAWAKNFTPEKGAIYTIRNKKHGTFALYNSGCKKDGTNILSTWAQFDQRSFFIIEGNADTGYTLRFKNEPTRYVMAVNTNDADSNVGTITIDGGEVPDSAKWKIVESEAGKGTWNIIPFAGSRGWNQRGSLGGNNCIGQWGTNDSDDNRWYIQKPSELASAAITARGDYDNSWSGKIGMPTEAGWNAWNTAVTTTASTLETTFSTTNATAFKNAFNALPALKTPQNGLYKIQNLKTSLYLFQTNEGNPKNFTLINDGGDNYKYYWKATFDGNVVSLKGSLGQAPSRGAQGKAYSDITPGEVMNTITMEGAPSASASYTEGAFLWPSVHSTEQWNFTVNYTNYNTDTNPYYLTTWTVTDSADQYTFEAVELTDGKQLYTVNVDRSVYNCDANVTFNSDSYAGNKTVNNGGFFILTESQAQAANFSAENTNGIPYYPATVTIDGTNINVTYTFMAQYAQDLINYAKGLIDASDAKTVGYPKTSTTVYSELNAAITAYNADQTASNINTLEEKLAAYKGYTTTADLYMPADGKAYKITAVFPNGAKQPLYWNSTRITAKNESNITVADSMVFICRANNDGTYTFVNNAGKYWLWCDSGDAKKSYSVHGISDSYIAQNNWTIERAVKENNDGGSILSSVTNADFFGTMQLKALNKTGNASYWLAARYEGDNADAAFIAGGDGAKWYDYNGDPAKSYTKMRTFTYAFEEVPYANVVSLKDASGLESGKNIATFSAPFPTVVPANTTAYTVETQNAHNVTEVSTYKVAEAGEAIPANTGVILMGTDTQVTMLPRTTETTVVIAAGALGNSAGAAKNITTENSYVLSNQSSLWAFYKVGAGATKLPMNKAYLVLPENPASVIRFNLVGTTGLDLVGADNAAAQGKVYDLTGREVKAAAKGLYIVGGKKVIVK